MATKSTRKRTASGGCATNVLGPMVKTSREFWLAGLGVLSFARKEGERLWEKGPEVLDKLVIEGKKFEKRSRQRVEEEAGAARARFEDLATGINLPRALRKAFGQAETVVFHLVPEQDDWAVRREGADEDLSVHKTKAAGLEAARGLARAQEPSRIVVHRADGTIQTSYGYGDN